MKTWTADAKAAGTRLDAWLAARPEIGSRGKARDAIECGKIFLNDKELVFTDAGRRLSAGDRVGFWPDRPGSSRPRTREIVASREALDLVYEDDSLIVVNKPPGWLVEPLPGEARGEVTLRDLLADHLRSALRVRPYVVHRIDRDTSGLVVFALSQDVREAVKAQFERRTPERIYLAVVNGRIEPTSGVWRDKLVWDAERLVQKRAHGQEERAKDAEARFRVVEQFRHQALIEVSLVTGKRNQIRVQAGSRGYALVGERVYRFGRARDEKTEPAFPRQALHAARLAFRHPATRRRVEFAAPLPNDLRALIDRLRKQR
ncbi:MAG TPA: RluA family pseudouridine synthase [Vicinamibacterales bacterium]|jgi:23S rRNA pseudouridine1911/1915/1917 synthase